MIDWQKHVCSVQLISVMKINCRRKDEKSKVFVETAFVTYHGQYQFLKVPFDLCNCPFVFRRFINHTFRPLVNDGIVLTYLDNLIIVALDVGEGIRRLQMVFQVASDYGLDINKNKCHICCNRKSNISDM